jgi:hypothetical protein
MEQVPFYVGFIFACTTFAAVWLFGRSAHHSRKVWLILLAWLALQAVVGISGFYTDASGIPPRFIGLIGPPLLVIIGLFATRSGKRFIDRLDARALVLLHTVRIPVELVLFWLCMHQAVPQLMTFEGRNFDIVSGISAPLVYYFGYVKKQLGKNILLLWNFACLGLLANIVIHAVLSAPFAFEQFAFEQPNIAFLYFPFIWLPCMVVPLVLFSHLVTIRRLLRA